MARGEKRSAARLAAVQALYQMDIAGKGLAEAMAEFEAHWIGREVEGVEFRPAEAAFFRDILSGVIREQKAIDRRVDTALADGWPLKRVEAVLRAVLRAGAYEVLFRRDVPVRAAISEYVDVARAFYGDDEPGLVNAVLDSVARETRGDELEKRA
jgi:transcription antitermination protein NusB